MNTPIKPAAARASDISTTVGPNKGPDIDRKASQAAEPTDAALVQQLRQLADQLEALGK
jgi:hypothetical protein